MDQSKSLSMEQQFSLHAFKTQVSQMDLMQAQDFLLELYEQMMVRESLYREVLRHEWGLEPPSQGDR